MDAKEKKIIATGWGLTTQQDRQRNILQQVTLELFTHEECTQLYSQRLGTLNRGIVESQQFCAGFHENSADMCEVII